MTDTTYTTGQTTALLQPEPSQRRTAWGVLGTDLQDTTMTDTTRQDHPADVYAPLVDAAASRTTGLLDYWSGAYVTEGGTWMLATRPDVTDHGCPRDLVAVTPGPIGGTRVHPLYIAVDPDLVDALRAALDGEQA